MPPFSISMLISPLDCEPIAQPPCSLRGRSVSCGYWRGFTSLALRDQAESRTISWQ